jgi:drug/metabolite transporter (DMT)-like permease
LALLLEVPGASVLAALFLGQVPPIAAMAGLAVIVAGTALVVVSDRGRQQGPARGRVWTD